MVRGVVRNAWAGFLCCLKRTTTKEEPDQPRMEMTIEDDHNDGAEETISINTGCTEISIEFLSTGLVTQDSLALLELSWRAKGSIPSQARPTKSQRDQVCVKLAFVTLGNRFSTDSYLLTRRGAPSAPASPSTLSCILHTREGLVCLSRSLSPTSSVPRRCIGTIPTLA